MSENKRKKPKEIHVDKLIIKADKVILHDEDDHQPRPRPRDPWGFFFPHFDDERREKDVDRDKDRKEHRKDDEKKEEMKDEERRPRGWSWI